VYIVAFLSDERLESMLSRGELAPIEMLPRMTFAALCLQAMKNAEYDPSRLLVSRERIKELLDDPHNATVAAVSIDTLRKLCRQAMSRSNA
jgi:hypothetical protein